MDACGCDGYVSLIDRRTAQRDRDSYHAKGPDRTTRMLLDMIETDAEDETTLLDIGGGIGIIDHELLRTRASRAVLVEASTAYLEAASEEAEAADLLDRLRIVAGDFVRHAEEIDDADIVTLDRVVCCYPDVEALVSTSAARARKLYGIVLPRDRWYVRWALKLENLSQWLKRRAFRAYAHPNQRVDELVMANGLRPRHEAFTLLWRVVLYRRDQAGRASTEAPA
jgi:magnesium-protoporphyrin O-methyltransferase